MKIFSFLLTLALALPAGAEELAHFPGWKINKIEQAAAEDGSYASGPEYYGLTPPDSRPPVSIDSRTAKLLRAGEAQPEEVYGKLAKNEKSESDGDATEEQYVYSAGNRGFAKSDEIASTLPGYEPEPTAVRLPPKAKSEGFGPASVASYGGVAGGAGASPYGGENSAGGAGSSTYQGQGNSTSANSAVAPNEVAMARQIASAAPGSNAAGNGSPRNGAAGGANGLMAGTENPLIAGGLKMANGSGAAVGTSPGAGSGGANGSYGSRPGVSGEAAPPPPCPKGRFVYDRPTLVRVKLPEGCGLIHISAWGGGGGSGFQAYEAGGGDSSVAATMVRELPGGGGGFMSSSWDIDARKYDLVVVVGAAGTAGRSNASQPGSTSFGGGGGYSGVFLAPKGEGGLSQTSSRAMAIGAGGKGGGGGAPGKTMTVPSSASDAKMTNQIAEEANGSKAGFHYYPERGDAGSPGKSGKVILEYF